MTAERNAQICPTLSSHKVLRVPLQNTYNLSDPKQQEWNITGYLAESGLESEMKFLDKG